MSEAYEISEQSEFTDQECAYHVVREEFKVGRRIDTKYKCLFVQNTRISSEYNILLESVKSMIEL